MKRINAYKKLFQIDNQIELAALKQTYRALVKQWHPDKFQDGDPLKEQAEEMGRQVVDGYHFLVSIAPETKAAQLADYHQRMRHCRLPPQRPSTRDYLHRWLLL